MSHARPRGPRPERVGRGTRHGTGVRVADELGADDDPDAEQRQLEHPGDEAAGAGDRLPEREIDGRHRQQRARQERDERRYREPQGGRVVAAVGEEGNRRYDRGGDHGE